jgi:predicted transcriptional regulator
MLFVSLELSDRRRRDATEIRYEVLMASISGKRKTHIMYESGLNLKQLNLYLGELMSQGALEYKPLEKRYFITDKGRAFISAFGKYRETVSMLGKAEAALDQFFSTTASEPVVAHADGLSSPARTRRHVF